MDDRRNALAAPPADAVEEAFGLRLTDWRLVGGGIDEDARVWRAAVVGSRVSGLVVSGLAAGDSVVPGSLVPGSPAGGSRACGSAVVAEVAVKVSVEDRRISAELLTRLAGHGVPGLVPPLRPVVGGVGVTAGGLWISAYPWITGRAGDVDGLIGAQWAALGRTIAAAHAVPVGALPPGLPRERFTHVAAADEFGAVDDAMRVALSSAAADPVTAEVAGVWLGGLAQTPTLTGLADRLAPAAQVRSGEFVLCHADPHLANVLVIPDGGICLLDWDDALLAPVERDLLFHLGGWDSLGASSVADQASFAAGYGSMAPDPLLLSYFRVVRLMEDLSFAGRVATDPAESAARRAWARNIVAGTLGSNGLLAATLAGLGTSLR